MFHKLMSLAGTYKLPVVIHTGMQSGNGNNNIMNSDPALLSGIFSQYPEIEFALYHGSYPYGGKLATLAKNFKNVYVDMSWVYAISPSYSERYLHEWLETVPVNKIMAFGGDMRCVENIYGELLFARAIISKVLISKVQDGYFTEDEAKVIARMILHDNVVRFYNLK
jgi:predicted TIM-barrel fold metal-dependent hydrolase